MGRGEAFAHRHLINSGLELANASPLRARSVDLAMSYAFATYLPCVTRARSVERRTRRALARQVMYGKLG
jgi:hypothetical protein